MLQFIRCKTEEAPGLSCGTGGASSRRLGPGGLAISGGTTLSRNRREEGDRWRIVGGRAMPPHEAEQQFSEWLSQSGFGEHHSCKPGKCNRLPR